MRLAAATWFVTALQIYLAAGALVAIPFVLRGAGRLDPAARGGSRGFRLIILPGCVLLWPLLARRWWRHGARHGAAPGGGAAGAARTTR